MYRCQVCGTCSQPRQPRLTYCIYRLVPRQKWEKGELVTKHCTQIEKELSVCRGCKRLLELFGYEETMKRFIDARVGHPDPHSEVEEDDEIVSLPFRRVLLGRDGTVKNGIHRIAALVPRCDICGASAEGGQITMDTILCIKHARSAQ